jgi:drug/metabolite transporter (DMT)-like permease
VTLLIPVTATLLGVLILGETLTSHQVAGALVITSGLLVIDGRLLERLGWRGTEGGLDRRVR